MSTEKKQRIIGSRASSNARLLPNLQHRGVDLARPRQIDHTFYVDSDQKLNSLANSLQLMGFTIDSGANPDKTFWIEASKLQSPDEAASATFVEGMADLCVEHQAEYDGWGTEVSECADGSDAESSEGNLVQEFQKLTEGIEANPRSADAYLKRALLACEHGYYEDAVADFSEIISINSQDATAYFQRGQTLAWLEKYAEAIADLAKAIELDPSNVEAYNLCGNTFWNTEQYDLAIAQYNNSIRIRPEDAEGYRLRANTYLKLQRYQEAIQDYSSVITICADAFAYFARGLCYLSAGDQTKAISDLSKSIDLDPESTDAIFERGQAFLAITDYQAAINDFSAILSIDSRNGGAYHYRARCYEQLGEQSLANKDKMKAALMGYRSD